MNIFWSKHRWACNRSIQERSKTHHTVECKSVTLKACQVSLSLHDRFCSSFCQMFSSHLSSTPELDETMFFLPNVKMDITRQCILWGLLGKVVFIMVLVFKEGKEQLRNQDRNKSQCTVWRRTVSSKAYRLLSSTAWWKVLTKGLGSWHLPHYVLD